MVSLKNEVAGVTAIVGFVSFVLAVSGIAAVLDVVVGGGRPPVVMVTGDNSTVFAAGGAEGGVLLPAVVAAFGLAGLVAVYTAIQSGYFDPETADAGSDAEAAPPTPEPEATAEPEGDADPA